MRILHPAVGKVGLGSCSVGRGRQGPSCYVDSCTWLRMLSSMSAKRQTSLSHLRADMFYRSSRRPHYAPAYHSPAVPPRSPIHLRSRSRQSPTDHLPQHRGPWRLGACHSALSSGSSIPPALELSAYCSGAVRAESTMCRPAEGGGNSGGPLKKLRTADLSWYRKKQFNSRSCSDA